MANIQIRKLQQSDEDGVCDVFCENFIRLEPLGRALNLDPGVDGKLWLDKAFPSLVSGGVSTVAVDTETMEIIAFGFAFVVYRSDAQALLFSKDDPRSRKLALVYQGLKSVHAGENFFEKYGIDKFVNIAALGTAEKYQRQGIGARTMEKTLDLIREKNIRLVTAESTGLFSGRVFQRFGFKKGNQINYDSMVLGGESLVMTKELEHHKGIVQYIKIL